MHGSPSNKSLEKKILIPSLYYPIMEIATTASSLFIKAYRHNVTGERMNYHVSTERRLSDPEYKESLSFSGASECADRKR